MVIEVKTNFGKGDIVSSLDNIRAAKRLNQYLTGLIVAFRSPTQIDTVVKNLEAYHTQTNAPTAILLLDKDIIIHNWSWQRSREVYGAQGQLLNSTEPKAFSYAVRRSSNRQRGLAVTFLFILFFIAAETQGLWDQSILVNALVDATEKYTKLERDDVYIGGRSLPT